MMAPLLYFDLLRLARDRRYWFWAVIGVPLGGPLLLGGLVMLMLVVGSPSTQSLAHHDRVHLVDRFSPPLGPYLEAQGIEVVSDVEAARGTLTVISDNEVALTLPRGVNAGQMADRIQAALDRHFEDYLVALHAMAGQSDQAIRATPATLISAEAGTSVSPALSGLVLSLYMVVIVFPYMQLARIAGTSVVSDRVSGVLAPLTRGSVSPWRLAWSRIASIGVVSCALVLFAMATFAIYILILTKASEFLVHAGVFEKLSISAAETSDRVFLQIPALYASLGGLDLLQVALAMSMQLWMLASLAVACSAMASTVARARLLEFMPFAFVFVLPLMAYGDLGALRTSVFSTLPGSGLFLWLGDAFGGAPCLSSFALQMTLGLCICASSAFVVARNVRR